MKPSPFDPSLAENFCLGKAAYDSREEAAKAARALTARSKRARRGGRFTSEPCPLRPHFHAVRRPRTTRRRSIVADYQAVA